MINHLEVSTLTALVCVAAALALRRASAALRHLILLIGFLRFAVYTPWLDAAGERLAKFVPAHHAAAPRLVHVTLRLLLPNPQAPVRIPANLPYDWSKWKQAAWWLWYAGAGFGLGTLLGRLRRPVRSVREATFWERDGFLQAAAAAGVERADLWIVSPDQAPGAQGWLRPRVLLPEGLTDQLSDGEIETVLAHELAHLRRRDPLIAGVARAISSIFWFHPLLWWMERQMLSERETACDEMVLSGGVRPEDYVAGIAKVCRNLLGRNGSESQPGYASFMGANLARRLDQIRSERRPWALPRMAMLVPVLMAVIAALVPVAGGVMKAHTRQNQAEALLQAAIVLDGKGLAGEAVPLYQKVIQEDPDNSVALNNLAYILAEKGGRLETAFVYAARAHQLKPDSLDIDDTLGWILVKRDMPDRAIATLRDPVLHQPGNFTFRNHMAHALDEELTEKADVPAWALESRGLIFGTSRESEARLKQLLESIGK